jgi:phosphatidylinositol alpha-1,6-mannosyltransferase
MRIGYVLPYLQRPSGWRTHACAFLQAIQPSIEPVLFVAASDLEAARLLFPGMTIFPLPVTQQASLSSFNGLRRLAMCYRVIAASRLPAVDIIHSMEAYPTGLVGTWLAQKQSCPHAITTHGTYGVIWREKALDRLAYQQVLNKTALFCPVSNGTAQMVLRYFGQALARTTVHPILNGNSYTKQVPQEQALHHSFPDLPILLSVGDLKPRKGQHVSLAAFARVKAQLPSARYIVVGSYKPDKYYYQLKSFVHDNQLEDVIFTGAVSEADLLRYYQESSLFILTPQQDGLHFEGFGLVYLVAGAYGLPVVATRTGGVPDAVKDGETGFLLEPEDVEGIAAAILRLLNNIELSRQMGRNNRRWAEYLTWERYAAEQFQAYQDLLSS